MRLYGAALVRLGPGDATINDAMDLVGQSGDGIRGAHHLFTADISFDLAGDNQDFFLRCSFSHTRDSFLQDNRQQNMRKTCFQEL